MKFSRQECWSGLPFPSPRGNWGIEKNYLTQVNTASNSGECYLNSGYQCLLFEKNLSWTCWRLVWLLSRLHTQLWLWCLLSTIYQEILFTSVLYQIPFPENPVFFPSCLLDPVSSSFLVYPLIWRAGYFLQYILENGCMTGELYEALHIWKCHVKCIYVIYIIV